MNQGEDAAAPRASAVRLAEERRLERAINLARWGAGAVALGAGPAFPALGWQFVLALGAGLFLYAASMHVLTRPRAGPPRRWPYRVAFWGDVAVVLFAMLVFVPDPIWSTFVFGMLVVVINGFRRGGWGAVVTAGALSAGYVALGLYRQAAFGYPLDISRAATNVSAYLLAALLMSGIVRELRALRGLYEPLLRAEGDLGEGVAVFEPDGRLVYWNDAIERLTGRDAAALEALPRVWDLFGAGEREAVAHALTDRGRTGKVEAALRRVDGTVVPVELAFAPISTALGRREVLVVRDVSETKRMWQALRDEALHDSVTGLPNRVLLDDRLEQAIAAARRSGSVCSLLLVGGDLKEIHEVFGRGAGEALFSGVAARIRAEVRAVDTLARLGQDELAVLLPSTEVADAEIVARKIVSALERPFRVGDEMAELSASVGIVAFPAHGESPYELLRRAEIAMHAARASSDGYSVFVSEQEPDRRKLLLLPELRRAIEQSELILAYQPEVSVTSGSVARLEALVRWKRGDEIVLPEHFVPIAERRGLIGALTLWVLGTALRDRRAWSDAGWPVQVSVNVSIQNLLDPGFPSTVARLCHSAGVDPSGLGIEVTESVLMVQPDRTIRCLSDLRLLGVHVAIDDFGTGYSSLAYLDRLPLDAVKVDRSFIRGLLTDSGCGAIIGATIDLGRHFGFELVAEGVEDEATLRRLGDLSIQTAQGYHLCPPLGADEVIPWLQARSPGARAAVRRAYPAPSPAA